MQEKEWTVEEKKAFVTSVEKLLIDALNAATRASPLACDGQTAEMLQVVALLQVMTMVLGQVPCPHCRQNLQDEIEIRIPSALDAAMREPTTQSHHVH